MASWPRAANLENRRAVDVYAIGQVVSDDDGALENGARSREDIHAETVVQEAAVGQFSGGAVSDGYPRETVISRGCIPHAEGCAVHAKDALAWAVLDRESLDGHAASAVNSHDTVEFRRGPASAVEGCRPLSIERDSIRLDAHPFEAGPGDPNRVARAGLGQDFRDLVSAIAVHLFLVRAADGCPAHRRHKHSDAKNHKLP
jgi:hypothetical protein